MPPNWHTQAKRETEALMIIKGHDLPTATPQLTDHGQINGWHYIVMNKLEGTNLHDIWQTLTEKEQCHLAIQVAEFAKHLHQIPLPQLSDNSELVINWNQHLKQQRDKCQQKYQDRDIEPQLKATMLEFVDSVDYQCHLSKQQLLHTDLHPGNMLVQQDDNNQWQLTGIIDFGDALIGPDRDYEYGTSALLMGLSNKTINHALLKTYGFDIKDKLAFQQRLTVLGILRHIGGIDYSLKRIELAQGIKNWSQLAQMIFAL